MGVNKWLYWVNAFAMLRISGEVCPGPPCVCSWFGDQRYQFRVEHLDTGCVSEPLSSYLRLLKKSSSLQTAADKSRVSVSGGNNKAGWFLWRLSLRCRSGLMCFPFHCEFIRFRLCREGKDAKTNFTAEMKCQHSGVCYLWATVRLVWGQTSALTGDTYTFSTATLFWLNTVVT